MRLKRLSNGNYHPNLTTDSLVRVLKLRLLLSQFTLVTRVIIWLGRNPRFQLIYHICYYWHMIWWVFADNNINNAPIMFITNSQRHKPSVQNQCNEFWSSAKINFVKIWKVFFSFYLCRSFVIMLPVNNLIQAIKVNFT